MPRAPPLVEQAHGDGDGAGDGGQAAIMPPLAQGAQHGPHEHRASAIRVLEPVPVQAPP